MTAVGSPASSSDELGRLLEQEPGDELEASAVEFASDATEGQVAGLPRTPELSLVDPAPLPPASIDTTLTSAAPVLSSTDAALRPGKRRKIDRVQGERPILAVEQLSTPRHDQPVTSCPAAATCPPHPGLMGGVCIRCGEFVEPETESAASDGVALRWLGLLAVLLMLTAAPAALGTF